MGWSVGKLFFFTSQIPYPLNLIVNSPNIGNKTKYTNSAKLKIFYLKIYGTVYIGQFSQFAMKFREKKILTENLNKIFRVGSFFQGRSGKWKQIKL